MKYLDFSDFFIFWIFRFFWDFFMKMFVFQRASRLLVRDNPSSQYFHGDPFVLLCMYRNIKISFFSSRGLIFKLLKIQKCIICKYSFSKKAFQILLSWVLEHLRDKSTLLFSKKDILANYIFKTLMLFKFINFLFFIKEINLISKI